MKVLAETRCRPPLYSLCKKHRLVSAARSRSTGSDTDVLISPDNEEFVITGDTSTSSTPQSCVCVQFIRVCLWFCGCGLGEGTHYASVSLCVCMYLHFPSDCLCHLLLCWSISADNSGCLALRSLGYVSRYKEPVNVVLLLLILGDEPLTFTLTHRC